jgi:hypothetical protein
MKKRDEDWMKRWVWGVLMVLLGLLIVGVAWGQDRGGATVPEDDLYARTSTLLVNPKEIDLGSLAPGEEAKGTYYLKSSGPGTVEWFAEIPGGWNLTENQNLSDIVALNPVLLRVRIAYLKEVVRAKNKFCQLLLRMEAGESTAVFRREVPVGDLRGQITFNYEGGTASCAFKVKLLEMPATPILEVEPVRLDLGTIRPGEPITKRIMLTNRGREQLRWKVGVAGSKGMPPTVRPPVGRYVSLRSETAGKGVYHPGAQAKEGMEFIGPWGEEGSYPSGQGEQTVLRYRFTGTGIILYYFKSPDGGPFGVYFDDQFVSLVDGYAERREREEIVIAERQADGPHQLTLVQGEGRVTLEGFRVIGKPIQRGPLRWIGVFPDSGMTTRETDYINLTINTRQLSPGLYGDYVFLTSNGGDADVEIFLEVAPENASRLLDVHRYLTGTDYLLTTNPQAEAARIQTKGYRHTGIPFKLFAPGTPGTTEFYRWFNPDKGDHYYSHDPKGGKTLPGYLFEGPIGNIATSRLAGTRELYRWYNASKGVHFYTTDAAGEGQASRGYKFEGISGFVR